MSTSRKSWLGGLSATAVALTMVGAGAGAALAAPGVGNIDPNADVSLTIEKHDGNKKPLDGATFEVCEVLYGSPAASVDLTNPAMWELIQDLNPATISDTADENVFSVSDTCENGTTGAAEEGSGKWVVPDVTQGLWMFQEKTAPTGYTADSSKYITTVPRPGTDAWIYDVVVQPKNLLEDLEKTASTATYAIGDVITWTVSNTITTIENSEITKWGLKDTLGTGLGNFQNVSVTIDDGTALETDYTLDATGSPITMYLSTAKLAELNNAPGEHKVVWTYTTTVTDSAASKTGQYVNDVEIDREIDEEGCDPNCPSTNGKVHYGDIKIKKVDNTEGTGLTGAKFQVFENEDHAKACAVAVSDAKGNHTTKCENAITIGSAFDFTSAETTGIAHIPGLYVDKGDSPATKTYYVVETVAPAGYVNAHIGATSESDLPSWSTVVVSPGATTDVDALEAPNAQQPPTTLPNTGAIVSGILIVAAIALGGGCIFLIASSRRKANQA